jgi:glycosyltransferase involved in cell wall biosynthesis
MALSNPEKFQINEVMYVIGSLSVGGTERHLVSIAEGLRDRGWQTSIFAFSRSGPLLYELESKKIPVYGPTPLKQENSRLLKYFLIWIRLIRGAINLAIILIKRKNIIIHFFLPSAYIVGGAISCMVGSQPRIMSRRSLNNYQTKKPLYRRIEHHLHSRMNILIGNSLAVVGELESETKGNIPIQLIYNGIKTDYIKNINDNQIRLDLNIKEDALVYVMVANLIPYKGHADLLLALASIRDQLPNPWNLICIGRDDGILSSLQSKAKNLGISENIRWLGLCMNVREYLAVADIAVSASHEEGFSNAVLESMLAGLPIVGTNVGGNSEAIINNITGYIVAPYKPYELGGALLKMATNKDRKMMGNRGKECVIKKFSMSTCLDNYEEIYRQVNTRKIFSIDKKYQKSNY